MIFYWTLKSKVHPCSRPATNPWRPSNTEGSGVDLDWFPTRSVMSTRSTENQTQNQVKWAFVSRHAVRTAHAHIPVSECAERCTSSPVCDLRCRTLRPGTPWAWETALRTSMTPVKKPCLLFISLFTFPTGLYTDSYRKRGAYDLHSECVPSFLPVLLVFVFP